MCKYKQFKNEIDHIQSLDIAGHVSSSEVMYKAYQKRNSFGLHRDTPIHRIFQEEYLNEDVKGGHLTMPRAAASVWKDPLENPLSSVEAVDSVSGLRIDLGSLVRSFYATCWTKRAAPKPSDWTSFSHGKRAIRISTTVGKLLDRIMISSDTLYMHRSWLVEVDYKHPDFINAMKNPDEVYGRLEPQGALLALSASVVRTEYSDEEEVRLLYNPSLQPLPDRVVVTPNSDLVRVPFNWDGFIDQTLSNP